MRTAMVIADAVAPAVAAWLLTYAIHSTMLLGVALLVGARLREQPAWRDWLWKVAVIGALVTTTAQSALRVEPLGGAWSPWAVATASVRAEHPSGPAAARADEAVVLGTGAGSAATCCSAGAVQQSTTVATARDTRALARRALAFAKTYWPTLLVGIWLLVSLGALVRFASRQRTLNRVLAGRGPVVDAQLLRALAELCAASGLRRPLRLMMTPLCPVPVALLRGEIVVPERFLGDLDREQQRAALAHEVAHQMRRDPQWLLLVHVLEAVFFFQPLQRRARRALRESAEVLCDDWAVQQTFSLGVARCLATVAAWVSPAAEWRFTAASALASRDSALVQRVERVLREQRVRPARRALAAASLLALPLLLLVAPAVSRADIPAAPRLLARVAGPSNEWQPTSAAAPAVSRQERAGTQERVIRPARPSDPLDARWAWALEEAARRRLRGFWIVYSFYRPVSRDEQFISDSEGVNFSGRLFRMTSLTGMLDATNPIGGRGTIGALFHFTAANDGRIDRIGHRSMSIGIDFGRDPVFWLGYAEEAESLGRLDVVFERLAAPALLVEVVEAYGVHPTTDRVLPFLARALRPEQPEQVRAEAAESTEYHQDARVVPLLVRVAQSDASSYVRAEAAEALGEQTPERALPALEELITASNDARVQLEAVEALGTLHTRAAVDALVRIIWEHRSPAVRREAVETLGDDPEARVIEQLDRILAEHPDEQVLDEALDVLDDLNDPQAGERIARAARSSRSAKVRREALELLGDAQQNPKRRGSTPSAEQFAALLEHAIFEDADRSVQLEALEVAAESLPRAVARRLLRRVIDEHPARNVRKEAQELLEDIG